MKGQAMRVKGHNGHDARKYDPLTKRFCCTSQHPWDGKRESAPFGVMHEDVDPKEAGEVTCPNCKATWNQ